MDFTLPDATAVGELPDRHGAQFGNVAPPVSWGNVPDKAKFLILVVDIPKVDSGTDDASVLWLVANINPATDGVGENQPPGGDIYIPWAGPTTGRGAQVKVRFRLYAVTKPLADPTESPLDIVIRLDRTNVGKSEFVVPYAPKAAS